MRGRCLSLQICRNFSFPTKTFSRFFWEGGRVLRWGRWCFVFVQTKVRLFAHLSCTGERREPGFRRWWWSRDLLRRRSKLRIPCILWCLRWRSSAQHSPTHDHTHIRKFEATPGLLGFGRYRRQLPQSLPKLRVTCTTVQPFAHNFTKWVPKSPACFFQLFHGTPSRRWPEWTAHAQTWRSWEDNAQTRPPVINFTSRWTAEDTTIHQSQSKAAWMSRDLREKCAGTRGTL